MHQLKKYQISVYRYLRFGGHHAIVISDGTTPHITFELTVMAGKSQAISGQERALAKVTEFSGDINNLEYKGEVECSLYELAERAARVLDSDRQYNWLSNNCQNFCNKFLESNDLPTYKTDVQSVQSAGLIVAAITLLISLFRGSSS